MSSSDEDLELLTARAYARHRGVSYQSVQAALRTGRISAAATKVGRLWQIDPELADDLWAANTDDRPRGNKPAADPHEPIPVGVTPDAPAWVDPNPDETLTEARLRHEKAKADLAEIRREEERGRLVDAVQQRREGFETGRLVRESLLQIADRLAPELAAEMDQAKVHDRLRRELIDALRHLAEEGGVEIQRGGTG